MACLGPGGSQQAPYGVPAPANFTGIFTWTWDGGDQNTIGGEHHEKLVVDMKLKVQAEYAGPFEGAAWYDDAGSTYRYDGTIKKVTPGDCTVTDYLEAHETGSFGGDSNLGALLEEEPPGHFGMTLYMGVNGTTGTHTITDCVGTTDSGPDWNAPTLICDESPEDEWGSWQWEPTNTVTFSCHAGDITESGTLQGSS